MSDLRRAREYEIPLGRGEFRILAGHPNYCWITSRHEGHTFTYSYLNSRDEKVDGMYFCDGDGQMAAALLSQKEHRA